ncbi:hypothetical protein NLG97_g1671 [Lecanicillium saksenae]|uniref:Uncharacterized protein n=1 Tax=Lecanicillium saksenae TaxID=468837 RepID=A0ACC1R508_9HYPO|nr:hypothetical protein NLG97_g1671 [Lecanicillium saksenae]
MATVNIIYPSGHNFDMDYYLKEHMPIVEKNWKQFGLQGFEIVHFSPGQQYQVQAILKWDSLDSYEVAKKSATAAVVLGDIANFTTAKPDIFFGNRNASKSFL